jgi:ParB family chromosome partitioning protein
VKNTLRGKALLRARCLIETRRSRGKAGGRGPRMTATEAVSANQLVKVYEAETLKQKMVIQKARLCEMRLTFSTEALKKLFRDSNFVTLLRAENLTTLPQFLVSRITALGG